MKDFQEAYLAHPQDQFKDPLLYLTTEVAEEVLAMQRELIAKISLANLAAVVLTAPFQTIVTSLQLSVKKHKTIYEQPAAKSKQLAKINTSLTVQEKRRMELMIRSGGTHRPYTAPVYEGYLTTIKGLISQGPMAFFKGLFFRSLHQMAHFYAFSEVALLSSNRKEDQQKQQFALQFIKLYLLQSTADITFNMLHIAQNRYVLQNIIPQFKVFRSAPRVIQKMLFQRQIFTGFSYHLLNNFFSVFMQIPFMLSLSSQQRSQKLALMYYASELIMYPFNTAFRRLACQHASIPGMIPIRYKSIWHGVRLILSEEGVLGLYKGFALYHMNIMIKLGLIFYCRLVIKLNAFINIISLSCLFIRCTRMPPGSITLVSSSGSSYSLRWPQPSIS